MSACTVTPFTHSRAEQPTRTTGNIVSLHRRVGRASVVGASSPAAATFSSRRRCNLSSALQPVARPRLRVIEGGLHTSVETVPQPPLSAVSTEIKSSQSLGPQVVTKGVRTALAIVASLVIIASGALTGALVGGSAGEGDSPANAQTFSSASVTP